MDTTENDSDMSPLSCVEVLERVYEYLDGELTPEVEAAIREHLGMCRQCYPHFRHEEVFLRFVERRTQIAKAPPALRRRIMQMLVNEEVLRQPE